MAIFNSYVNLPEVTLFKNWGYPDAKNAGHLALRGSMSCGVYELKRQALCSNTL
jgi:hypothetical protein